MGRETDNLWLHWTEFTDSTNKCKVRCNYCRNIQLKHAPKCRKHLIKCKKTLQLLKRGLEKK